MNNLQEQLVALAAVFQAAVLVDRIAKTGSAAEAGNNRFALSRVGCYSGAGKKYGACRCRYYACDIHFNLLFH